MRRSRTRRRLVEITENKKVQMALIIISVSIIIISIIGLIIRQNINKREVLLAEQARQEELSKIFEASNEEVKELEHHIKPSKVKIKVLGNILCENEILKSAYNSETHEYDFSNIFSRVKESIINSDIIIGSLETNFYNENYSSHNSPKSLINAIKELNVQVLNIGNNQNLSDGVEGLISTKKALQEAEIDTYGTSIGEEDSNFLIKEVNGIKIAFLSYITKIDEQIKITEENSKYINLYSEEKVDEDFKKVKEQGAEYICVNIHTGNTQHKISIEEQENINEKLISVGADLIIGTHQKKIGKLEVKQNLEGKNVFIVNSLGNLISEASNLGMILDIEITRSEKEGGTILSKVVYTPVYTIDNGKKSKNRYEIVDIRNTIKKYENEDNTIVDKKIYNKLKNSLNEIETLIR